MSGGEWVGARIPPLPGWVTEGIAGRAPARLPCTFLQVAEPELCSPHGWGVGLGGAQE